MTYEKLTIGRIPAILWGEPSDKVFLYVHGKMSRKEHAEVFASIAEKNGWQTVSFDLPESGERMDDHECRLDVWNGTKDLAAVADYVFASWKKVGLYACSLGAYFALNTFANGDRNFEKCLFLSPIVDMQWLVENMMLWSGVTKEQLEKEGEIESPIDTIRWDYYQYILAHPAKSWPYKTSILYASEDDLQPESAVRAFTERFGAELTISQGSKHPFMEEKDTEIVNGWLWGNMYRMRIESLEGNRAEYSSAALDEYCGEGRERFSGRKALFLGSSVTFGAASMEDGIPEYFAKRLGMEITKEAVSGTTLVDLDDTSYVSRLRNNVDIHEPYDLMVCQLSTNDATRGLPLGEIGKGREMEDFDTSTITGAMEYIIAYGKKNWHCPVFFYTGSRYDSRNYEAMVGRLYELAEKWQIGVLDLWTSDEFNAVTDEERSLYMADPIHPTRAGYMKWWCPEMERQLLEETEPKTE